MFSELIDDVERGGSRPIKRRERERERKRERERERESAIQMCIRDSGKTDYGRREFAPSI